MALRRLLMSDLHDARPCLEPITLWSATTIVTRSRVLAALLEILLIQAELGVRALETNRKIGHKPT